MTDYLAELDAADEEHKFAMVREWIDTQPLQFFKVLREQRPILATRKATLVTRLDDCIEVLNQPKIFTVQPYVAKMTDFLMSNDDNAFHTREKSIMQGFLNRDDLPRVRAMVKQIADDILKRANGQIEFVGDYCRMVPSTLVQDYFGLDGIDRKELIDWSYWNQADTFYNQPFDDRSDTERKHIIDKHQETNQKLSMYIVQLMARKVLAVKTKQTSRLPLLAWYKLRTVARKLSGKHRETSTDDIVSRMIVSSFAEEVDFDLQRVGVNAGGLLIGAIETTSQAVAQTVQFLVEHPQHLALARQHANDSDSSAFDDIVWEALRYVPISPYLFRQTSTETVIARGTERELTVPAGGYVLAVTQSAMFDPRAFDDPESFKPGRNWYHQFHFGFGEHACLGRYIGAQMIPEMVRQIVLRNDLQQQGPIDYQGGHLPQKYALSWS